MKETVVMLSFVFIELTLLVTVGGHQAVNPLKDAASPHEHEHHRPPVQQQQQQHHGTAPPPAQHHQSARGIDRNAVHNQE